MHTIGTVVRPYEVKIKFFTSLVPASAVQTMENGLARALTSLFILCPCPAFNTADDRLPANINIGVLYRHCLPAAVPASGVAIKHFKLFTARFQRHGNSKLNTAYLFTCSTVRPFCTNADFPDF